MSRKNITPQRSRRRVLDRRNSLLGRLSSTHDQRITLASDSNVFSDMKKITNKEKPNVNKNVINYIRYLIDNNKKGNDDDLPFFYNHPPIQGFFNLCELARGKNQELHRAYEDVRIEKVHEKYDIVTIIPFRGRWMHLEKTLESLTASVKDSNFKVGFIIVENSKESIFNTDVFSDFKNVHYRWINSGGKIFNKCFCHNIGAGITNSNFVHFHDCDLIVPLNFYSELNKCLDENPAVQCFSGRKVNYINESYSMQYFDSPDIGRIIQNSESYREGTFGAPGGSIALSRDLFTKVGGFDPHFFWAYSIEDMFFWKKIEKYTRITTMEDPKIDLYHLWHPPGWGKNPYERFEQRIYQLFTQDRFGWQNYINTSRNLYNELIEKFIF